MLDVAPDNIGVKVGAFTDPTFPAMNVSALPMPGDITPSCGASPVAPFRRRVRP